MFGKLTGVNQACWIVLINFLLVRAILTTVVELHARLGSPFVLRFDHLV